MSRSFYFAQYESPNIVIVPTVSFPSLPVHLDTEQIAVPITSNDCEEQITHVDDNIVLPSGSNGQQNLQDVDTNLNGNTSEFSDNLRNSPLKQDTVSTNSPQKNMSQTIKELTSSKYKSRNSLVDLTGFNLLKRDITSSLTKRKDSNQVDYKMKIEQDKTKAKYKKEHRDDPDNRDTSKPDNLVNKESLTSVKPRSTRSKLNVKNFVNDEPKENTVDMEDKMKKYFRQLWKRNVNKLKDVKSSSKAKEEPKNSKPESSRTKANLQKVSKSKAAEDNIRNKIKNSENNRDLEKRLLAKYSSRSKSEKNTRHSSDSKESIRHRKKYLISDSIERHKQQRCTRLDDHESKYKDGNKNKTETFTHKEMTRMKSCETTTNNRDIKNKDERLSSFKHSVKSEKLNKVSSSKTQKESVQNHTNIVMAKDQINKKVKLVKSIVQVDKKIRDLSQSRCLNEVQDLRSKLSRKRTKSECFTHSYEPMKNRHDRENLVITVKQDVKSDSKDSALLAPNVNKPKPKKFKKIKLVINIECPNFNSDDSDQEFNECCQPHEDLSFLDDFNVDEIVDSLNSQVELKKSITTDLSASSMVTSQVNNKINKNDNNAKQKRIEKTKPKDDLTNDINIIKKEDPLHKLQVVEINSDAEDEDLNPEKGSIASTKKCKEEQTIKTDSKTEINTKQEVKNNITDLTGTVHKENTLENIMDLCVDSNDSVLEVIDITDENINMTSKHSLFAENVNPAKCNKVISNVDRIFELLSRSNKPNAKRRQNLDDEVKKSPNVVNTNDSKTKPVILCKDYKTLATGENTLELKAEHKCELSDIKVQKQIQKSKDPIEASLATMFDHNEQMKSVNITDLKIDVISKLSSTNIKKDKEISENTEDPVEASLKTIFNNNDQNCRNDKPAELNRFNRCDKMANYNSNLKNPVDAVELSLETMFNAIKKQDTDINMNSKQMSLSRRLINKETKTMNSRMDQKTSNKIGLQPPSVINKHVKLEPEHSQKSVNQILTKESNVNCMENILVTHEKDIRTQSSINQNKNTKTEPLQCKEKKRAIIIDEKRTREKSEKHLEIDENMAGKNAKNKINKKQLCTPDINVKNNLLTFEDTDKKPADTDKKPEDTDKKPEGPDKKPEDTDKKPIDEPVIIEKKTNNEKSSPPAKNHCQETKKTLQTAKTLVEHCLASPQIDNNQAKIELLSKFKETRIISKATINESEQKTNATRIIEFNTSHKNKTLLPLPNSQTIPEKGNSQQKINISTRVALTNPDKDIEDKSKKTSINFTTNKENSVMPNNKEIIPTSVENQAKSLATLKNRTLPKTINDDLLKITDSNIEKTNKDCETSVENQAKIETMKNNTQPKTVIDDLLKTKDTNIEKVNKDSELDKRCEIETKSEVQQDGIENTSFNTIVRQLEPKISRHLRTKFTISSIIHYGSYSALFKCNDGKGETYAVKIVYGFHSGKLMENMLCHLKQYKSRQDSCVLFLMSAYDIRGRKCLLTEYYPTNLEQALREEKRSFPIDQVQYLSMQLVDAVNMLTNAGIIHTDIKPTHILLNNAQDRLKLCGFDEATYSNCSNITPNTGTPSYRAPEVILGFMADHMIDVWSTALVIFEMATHKTLFPADYNNAVLFYQLCTLGCFDWSMVEQSRHGQSYFVGTSFLREVGNKARPKTYLVHTMHRNNRLRRTLFLSYDQQWAGERTGRGQVARDREKLEMLHALLEQMLILDPRHRLPIQFVGTSEFLNSQF